MKLLQKERIIDAIVEQDDPKAKISAQGQLQIVGGSRKRAKLVSYNPVVGRAISIRTGDDANTDGESLHVQVQPREAIFITSRETFRLQKNQVGICFGRVINAHRSLMIDANFIDPGYDGELHCVLRNFGANACAIDLLKTPIMKVVIFELDGLDAEKSTSPEESIARTITDLKEQQIERQRRETRVRWLSVLGSLVFGVLSLVVVSKVWPAVFQGNGLLQAVVTLLVFFLGQVAQMLASKRKE